jgi:hypothetical protein
MLLYRQVGRDILALRDDREKVVRTFAGAVILKASFTVEDSSLLFK